MDGSDGSDGWMRGDFSLFSVEACILYVFDSQVQGSLGPENSKASIREAWSRVIGFVST